MHIVVLLGRILYSSLFIIASLGHFAPQATMYAMGHGVPMATFLVPFSGLIGLLGGISILIGFRAKIGAWLLVIFLIPVTFMMHQFWMAQDPARAGIEQAMFMKNLALLGTAFIIAYFGSGPMSVDKKKK